MDIVINILFWYITFGVMALIILDGATHRIRKRLKPASTDTQLKLAGSGSYVGSKLAIVLTAIALLLFWPVAIYGALSTLKGGKSDGKKG